MNRFFYKSVLEKWNNPKDLIQVFTGPRQVGKTTTALKLSDPEHTIYASADLPTPPMAEFIEENWVRARTIFSEERTLILDEVQKIPDDQTRKTKGLACPFGVISHKNILPFFQTKHLGEIDDFLKAFKKHAL